MIPNATCFTTLSVFFVVTTACHPEVPTETLTGTLSSKGRAPALARAPRAKLILRRECTAIVRPKDRVVIPQTGPTLSENFGPPVIRFQLIQTFGGGAP